MTLQNKILRIIILYYIIIIDHQLNHFRKAYRCSYCNIAIQRIALQMYKYSYGMLPTVIQLLFTNNDTVHEHNTMQKICLRQPTANREYMYRNFGLIGVYIWNHLISKTTINTMNTYNSFKYSLKQYLLDNIIIILLNQPYFGHFTVFVIILITGTITF